MDKKKILILTAVEMEARALCWGIEDRGSKIEDRGKTSFDPRSSILDLRFSGPIAIGIRATRLTSLDIPNDISAVFLCGLAGGLNPDLAIGDVILDDPSNVVFAAVPIRRGRIHTATDIIASPAQKAELFASTQADAVDMEQSIVQAWCDQRGIPLIGLRAISDTAGETLNPAVIGFVDDLGRPKPAKLAIGLIRQPGLIPELVRLNSATKLALERLNTAARSLMS